MKYNFSSSLSGRKLAPYLIGLWWLLIVFIAAMSWGGFKYGNVGGRLLGQPTLVDSRWILSLVIYFGGLFLFYIGVLLQLFFVVKYTLEAVSVRDSAFETDYDFGRYATMVVWGALLSAITCGIYLPWFLTRLIRFFADGTSHRFNLFSFGGRAMTLFGITVLLVLLPSVVIEGFGITYMLTVAQLSPESVTSLTSLWIVLLSLLYMLFICVYQVLAMRWAIDFGYGNRRIALKMPWWSASWFLLGQTFLSTITLGLYLPVFVLRWNRYCLTHAVLGQELVEERFGMLLRPWRDWGFVWCQMLLSFVTLGIYYPWAYAKIVNRFVPRCSLDEIDSPSEEMPAE